MWRLFPTPQGKAAFTKARRHAFFSTAAHSLSNFRAPSTCQLSPATSVSASTPVRPLPNPAAFSPTASPSQSAPSKLDELSKWDRAAAAGLALRHIFPKQRAELKLVSATLGELAQSIGAVLVALYSLKD